MTRSTATIITIAAIIAIVALLAVGFATPAGAADLTVDLGGTVHGDPGTTVDLETVTTPAGLVDQRCQVTLAGANNKSTHPDNDLHVGTAGSTLTFPDIEDTPNSTGAATGTLILGSTIAVTMTLGADGISSGGFALAFDCHPTATTTTTTIDVPPTVPPWTRPPGSTIPPTRTRPATPATPTFTG